MMDYLCAEKRYGTRLFDFAMSFRNIALEIDQNPASILKYCDLPAIQMMLSDRALTAKERVQYFEALSYGDPGVMLASPGASLSGLLLQELGTPSQIDLFYSLVQNQKMRTFFALTEPKKGSDANHIETTLSKKSNNQYILSGTKAFFGNGKSGKMGVVFAKTSSGPLGIRAVWLTPELLKNNGITRETLPMFGLRGAQIAVMHFENCIIPEDAVLGHHLSACAHGSLGITKVFNRLRSGVGALAIGQAQAVCDTLYHHNKNNSSLFSLINTLNTQLKIARNLLQSAAEKVDQNSFEATHVSIAKTVATHTAEKVISTCIDHFDIEALLKNSWLLKAYRDVFCWEFMEGTSYIQKKIIARDIENKVRSILSGENGA